MTFQLNSDAGVTITKNEISHNRTIQSCRDDNSGLYHLISGEHSTQGTVSVGGISVPLLHTMYDMTHQFLCIKLNYTFCFIDIPEFDRDNLQKFSKPVIVRVGQNAAFKIPFAPQESLVVSWFKDGTEIKEGGGIKIIREPNHSRLLLRDCLRTDTGKIKIQLKNPFGAVEATSQLIVLGTK